MVRKLGKKPKSGATVTLEVMAKPWHRFSAFCRVYVAFSKGSYQINPDYVLIWDHDTTSPI